MDRKVENYVKGDKTMKIKLAILEKDTSYLNRIVAVFSTKYADKFEVYSFTDQMIAISALEGARIDVLLASDSFEIDGAVLPKRCSFAYFVDSPDIDAFNGEKAICKFQKVDLIYKQILSVYSENAGKVSGLKLGDDTTQVIVFSSPNGGCGNSAMAAACAMYFSKNRKKTLYLNLENFGGADCFFYGEGQFDMSDAIFALKSKKANLSMKLESCVKQGEQGVFFYSQSKVALDMLELTTDDMLRFVTELKLTGNYDYIIIDMDFSLSKDVLNLYRQAHGLVWVGNGSETSNNQIVRAFQALSIIEQNAEAPLTQRLSLIYNKFSNKTSKVIGDIGLRNIGGVPRYEHANEKQVVEQLANMNLFEKII